jgi:hypothetical protein
LTDGIWETHLYPWVGVQEEEFKQYNNSLQRHSDFFNKNNYFDVRGNHDTYNCIEELHNRTNFYKRYGMSGDLYKNRIFEKVIIKRFGRYRIIGIDGKLNYL